MIIYKNKKYYQLFDISEQDWTSYWTNITFDKDNEHKQDILSGMISLFYLDNYYRVIRPQYVKNMKSAIQSFIKINKQKLNYILQSSYDDLFGNVSETVDTQSNVDWNGNAGDRMSNSIETTSYDKNQLLRNRTDAMKNQLLTDLKNYIFDSFIIPQELMEIKTEQVEDGTEEVQTQCSAKISYKTISNRMIIDNWDQDRTDGMNIPGVSIPSGGGEFEMGGVEWVRKNCDMKYGDKVFQTSIKEQTLYEAIFTIHEYRFDESARWYKYYDEHEIRGYAYFFYTTHGSDTKFPIMRIFIPTRTFNPDTNIIFNIIRINYIINESIMGIDLSQFRQAVSEGYVFSDTNSFKIQYSKLELEVNNYEPYGLIYNSYVVEVDTSDYKDYQLIYDNQITTINSVHGNYTDIDFTKTQTKYKTITYGEQPYMETEGDEDDWY